MSHPATTGSTKKVVLSEQGVVVKSGRGFHISTGEIKGSASHWASYFTYITMSRLDVVSGALLPMPTKCRLIGIGAITGGTPGTAVVSIRKNGVATGVTLTIDSQTVFMTAVADGPIYNAGDVLSAVGDGGGNNVFAFPHLLFEPLG